ncbi:MAG: MarC family protein, partial [Sedimentisphaerales bacterium]
AIGFVFLGQLVFRLLGITIGDFMVAGGALLFCIAIIDLVSPGKERRIPDKNLGAVPIGTPLIVGPAVLATSLLIISEYGLLATVISVIVNILFAGLVFSTAFWLIKVLGEAGTKALSKIMSLLLAAIAVMLWHILQNSRQEYRQIGKVPQQKPGRHQADMVQGRNGSSAIAW